MPSYNRSSISPYKNPLPLLQNSRSITDTPSKPLTASSRFYVSKCDNMPQAQ
jgi:hypothetical protein